MVTRVSLKEPRCPDCAILVVADQRFCHGCGAKLGTSDDVDGERRHLTAVACSWTLPTIAHSDEDAHEEASRFLDLVRSEVGRFGGVIAEQAGAHFLALFGVPVAHEDHCRRAALAAMALRDALATGRPADLLAVIRIGVSTGEAVVALAGGRVVSVLGRPVEVASELASLASGGEILVDEATEHVVAGYVACRGVDFAGSDVERGVAVFIVEGEGKRVSRLDRPDLRVTRFVGRQRQLTTLGELLDEAQSGRGQVIGLAAEAGMGKSRLVAEFLATSARGVRLREGRCLSYASGTPFVPIVDLLRAQVAPTASVRDGGVIDSVHRRLAGLGLDSSDHAAYLANVLGARDADDVLRDRSPEAIREGTFESIVALFVAEAAEAPTIFLIEDLHWVDPISQDVIARLVESLPGRRALLLCTYRPGYRAPWMDVSYATQLALPPLNAVASRELVGSIVGERAIAEELLDAVVVRADGNPFFLEELGYGLAGGAVEEGAVPATVHDVLAARINQLDDPARGLLRTASVLGREFPRELLAEIWNGEGKLATLLDELRRKEFLFEEQGREPPTLLFRHALTHDVAYSGLLASRRRELHGAAGEALERIRADHPEEVYGQLGYHFSRAGEHSAAVKYLALGAERALQAYSNESAAELLELALRHVEESGDADLRQDAPNLVFRLAFTSYLLGRFRDGLDRLQSPLAEPQADQRGLVAEHQFWLAYFHTHLGNSGAAHDHASRAIAIADELGDAFTAGRAYYVLTREDFWLCRYAQGVEHGCRAVELLDESEEWWWWLGHASSWKGLCHYNRGEFEQALSDCRRMNRIGVERQDPRLQSYSEWNLGWIEATRGDAPAGILHCLRSLQQSPDPLNSAYSTGWLGFAYRENGDFLAAVSHLEQAITSLREFGYMRLVGWFGTWLADAYLWSGQREAARACASESLEVSRNVGYPWAVAVGTRAEGRIAEVDGRPDEAERLLRDALDQFGAIDASFDAATTRLDLARLKRARGDEDAAHAELGVALGTFEASAAPMYVQRANEMLGSLPGAEAKATGATSPRAEPAFVLPLAIHSLGALQLKQADRSLNLRDPDARKLLAALLAARAPVHRDRIIRWLWPERTPDAAERALAATMADLADAIGPHRVVKDGHGLRFALGREDTWDIADLLRRGSAKPELEGTVDVLASALLEYAPPPFSEWPDADWAESIRRDCANALAQIRGRLAQALLSAGRPDEALPHFAQLVEVDPQDEAWHRGLMRCHAHLGDTALALRQFHSCRSILRQTRAADPAPETQALYLELLDHG